MKFGLAITLLQLISSFQFSIMKNKLAGLEVRNDANQLHRLKEMSDKSKVAPTSVEINNFNDLVASLQPNLGNKSKVKGKYVFDGLPSDTSDGSCKPPPPLIPACKKIPSSSSTCSSTPPSSECSSSPPSSECSNSPPSCECSSAPPNPKEGCVSAFGSSMIVINDCCNACEPLCCLATSNIVPSCSSKPPVVSKSNPPFPINPNISIPNNDDPFVGMGNPPPKVQNPTPTPPNNEKDPGIDEEKEILEEILESEANKTKIMKRLLKRQRMKQPSIEQHITNNYYITKPKEEKKLEPIKPQNTIMIPLTPLCKKGQAISPEVVHDQAINKRQFLTQVQAVNQNFAKTDLASVAFQNQESKESPRIHVLIKRPIIIPN